MEFKRKLFTLITCIAILLTSCRTPQQTSDDIATAVAQTVQAQNALTEVSALPTLTPAPPLEFTFTPETDSATPTTSTSTDNPGCVTSATLVSENPPDGTLYKPGEYFWKTWTFLNTGTCTWDQSYSLVFWEVDRMGGLTSYALPEVVPPEDTINISIYLQAPTAVGTSTSHWKFKTPWGTYFGVGPKSISFYVQIGVSVKPRFGITSVTFKLLRDPEKECPINVTYIVEATVISNGSGDFTYFWDQSDGNESGRRNYEFTQAGSATFKREWMIALNDSPNPRWIQFIITDPVYREYERVVIDHDCFHK